MIALHDRLLLDLSNALQVRANQHFEDGRIEDGQSLMSIRDEWNNGSGEVSQELLDAVGDVHGQVEDEYLILGYEELGEHESRLRALLDLLEGVKA